MVSSASSQFKARVAQEHEMWEGCFQADPKGLPLLPLTLSLGLKGSNSGRKGTEPNRLLVAVESVEKTVM